MLPTLPCMLSCGQPGIEEEVVSKYGARAKVVFEPKLRFLSHYMALFESGVYYKFQNNSFIDVIFLTTDLPKQFR